MSIAARREMFLQNPEQNPTHIRQVTRKERPLLLKSASGIVLSPANRIEALEAETAEFKF